MNVLTQDRGGWCLLLLLAIACQARGNATLPREFDGLGAFRYLQQQISYGPRVPNTPAHRQAGDWILAQLSARADTVIVQEWTQRTTRGESLRLRNFLARYRPEATERILLLAHWDTRPRADKSANLGQQRLPVPGANDGASGVAVLLGVADALKSRPPRVGVDLLFVDGEDYGDFADSTESLMGSRYFAAHQPTGYPPLFAVLFDMVGDRDLQIYHEGYSQSFAPEVVDRVWRTARELGYERYFVPGVRHTVTDDHVPLQQAGIHAIVVIDFDYGSDNGYWHTTDDTIDKVSAASLKVVGDVAVALVR